MRVREVVLGLVPLALAAAAMPGVVQAAPTATVAGRIRFRDATRVAQPGEVERMRWGHIAVDLRRGSEVLTARPSADGAFTVTGPPGTYVLEYIRLGELAEFFEPHAVDARAGEVTCIGTLEISVPNLANDLGSNTASEVHVVDDCPALRPALANLGGASAPEGAVRTSLARPAPYPEESLSALDVLLAFRAEMDVAKGGLSSVRGDFVLPLGKQSSWLVAASVTHMSASFVDSRWPAPAAGGPAPKSAWGATGGAGYRPWTFLEAVAYGGYSADAGRGAHGGLAGFQVRLGWFMFGIGGRMDFYGSGDSVGALTLDLSPIGLLGSLL
jgi:hypothetical protein